MPTYNIDYIYTTEHVGRIENYTAVDRDTAMEEASIQLDTELLDAIDIDIIRAIEVQA